MMESSLDKKSSQQKKEIKMSKKNRNGNGNTNEQTTENNTNEEPTKVKKFRKAGLYVIIFNDQIGEILPFEKKKELDSWLLANEIKEHENPELAEKKFLQISDGRSCLINYGLIKGVRIVVKKKMTV